MAEERLDHFGAIMSAIRGEGAAIVGGDPAGLYIYGEVEGGVVFAAVFKDEGDAVRYFRFTHELADLLRDAWEAESEDEAKRWTVIEYEVRGTNFDVQFTYSEELNPEEDSTDRREAALQKRYGEKPVIYPPIPERFRDLKGE